MKKCGHSKRIADKRILTQQTTRRQSNKSLLWSYFGCSSPSTPCSCFLLSFLLWCCLLLLSSTSFQLRSPRSFFSCSSTTAFNDSRTSSSGRYKSFKSFKHSQDSNIFYRQWFTTTEKGTNKYTKSTKFVNTVRRLSGIFSINIGASHDSKIQNLHIFL